MDHKNLNARKKKNTRKKIIAMAAIASVATIGVGICQHYKSIPSKRIEYALSLMKNNAALEFDYWDRDKRIGGAVTGKGLKADDMIVGYFKEHKSYIILRDNAENGYGQIDEMTGFVNDGRESYKLSNPSKLLNKMAMPYMMRGVEGTIDQIENGRLIINGPDYQPVLEQIIEEGERD